MEKFLDKDKFSISKNKQMGGNEDTEATNGEPALQEDPFADLTYLEREEMRKHHIEC